MKKILALAALLIGSSFAGLAQADDIALGEPGYGGTGCPGGSVSLLVLSSPKPTRTPSGVPAIDLTIDYRGYNNIPSGARTTFNVEYFFAGQRGPTFTKNFNGALDDDYLITNKLQASALVWSACGADVNLRTNSSIRVQTRQNKEALATVDSEDVNAAIVYALQWKKC